MELIFVLVAVCPAVILAKYDLQGKCFQWHTFIVQFAKWFYSLTLINFIVLYLQGMGNFDFSVLTVQFLTAYMLHSIAITIFVRIVKNLKDMYAKGRQTKEGGTYDC